MSTRIIFFQRKNFLAARLIWSPTATPSQISLRDLLYEIADSLFDSIK
jgi:hypothetical protein